MPYRTAPLPPPIGRPRRRWPIVVAACALAAGEGRLARSIRARPSSGVAGARATGFAHGVTLASGGQVTALRGAGDDAVVVRLPGRLVRRGTDLVRVPEVLPARGAVALMPDGAWAIDADGHFFDVSSAEALAACARRPCVAQEVAGHGRVVQVTGRNWARLADGAIAHRRDGSSVDWIVAPADDRLFEAGGWDAWYELRPDGSVRRARRDHDGVLLPDQPFVTGGLSVPEPTELIASAASRLICARGRSGQVRCGEIKEEYSGGVGVGPMLSTVRLPDGLRAARLAVSGGTLCFIGIDGALSCGTAPYRYNRPDPSVPLPLARVDAAAAVTEVALSGGVGCARERSGEVRCWGQVLRDGGVVRRDTPVAIAGLDAVERLVTFRGYACALQRGVAWCWGGASSGVLDRPPTSSPRPLATGGPVTELVADENHLCVGVLGAVRCWSDDLFATPFESLAPPAGASLHSLVLAHGGLIALDRAALAWTHGWGGWGWEAPSRFSREPDFDGFERVVQQDAWTCALRAGALRCLEDHDPIRLEDDRSMGEAPTADARRRGMLALLATAPAAVHQVLTSTRALEIYPAYGGMRAALGEPLRSADLPLGPYVCAVGVRGHVACRWNTSSYYWGAPPPEEEASTWARVPGLDDAVETVITAGSMACARRASGGVACWGINLRGALTAAVSDRAPSLFGLDEILARVGR